MGRFRRLIDSLLLSSLLAALAGGTSLAADQEASKEQAECASLARIANLTILSAEMVEATATAPRYCRVSGLISPAIHYHVQLPLPSDWNGRFVKLGDGGKDGVLNFANHRVAQGYAVANSNTGHDNGSEPGASFAFNNRQAEIDFGYRAVHLTANAAKTVIKVYYGKEPRYSYFEGCSTGGRQGLMEAQRFPYDFDGIVAGAPVYSYQATNATSVWMLQRLFKNDFAGNLAFDSKGDGSYASLTKLEMLRDAVLAKCDTIDGIRDGVIDDPLSCDFKPERDLAGRVCPGDVNADNCYTRAQMQTIKDIYSGSYDSQGRSIFKGKVFGSEFSWAAGMIPNAANRLTPARMGTGGDHINFLFYEKDPGVPPPNLTDLSHVLDTKSIPPEFAWWEFNIDDVSAGKADVMMSITDAKDPDLTRFLFKNGRQGGRFLLYHGWSDGAANPEPTLDYYLRVVAATFKGDIEAARGRIRLFMVPGMDHCGGGPGPNSWDKLSSLVGWVEQGKAPDFVVATHSANNVVDNERPICAYPQRAAYTGPAGGQNDPANWVARNFTCR